MPRRASLELAVASMSRALQAVTGLFLVVHAVVPSIQAARTVSATISEEVDRIGFPYDRSDSVGRGQPPWPAGPCPPPPIKAGWEAVPYDRGVNAHDCVCGPSVGLQGNQPLQCRVDGDTVHIEGTAQCIPGVSNCFSKDGPGGKGLEPDSDPFANLPINCRPSTTNYGVNVTLWSSTPPPWGPNPLAHSDITINTSGSMWISGSSIQCDPGDCGVWCMMIKDSFQLHPPPPPPLSSAPCIRFGHTIPVDHHVRTLPIEDVHINDSSSEASGEVTLSMVCVCYAG